MGTNPPRSPARAAGMPARKAAWRARLRAGVAKRTRAACASACDCGGDEGELEIAVEGGEREVGAAHVGERDAGGERQRDREDHHERGGAAEVGAQERERVA